MSAAPDLYMGPAFVGWRSWRVMPFEQLGKPTSLRLCASGLNGLPKVWEPGHAAHAVCGQFRTTHEAPWLDCSCGFYAYRMQYRAEDHLASFIDSNNGNDAIGWAFGRVSLWGRIVECEDGWRSEYAYPYAITVYGTDELAARLRGLYGVDVDARPVEDLPRLEDDDEADDESDDGLSDVAARLEKVSASLASLRGATATKKEPPKWLSAALYRDADGVRRTDEQELDYVEARLYAAYRAAGGSPVTAIAVAENVMRDAGATDFELRQDDHLGPQLYELAMRHDVVRLRGPKGRKYWAPYRPESLPDGFKLDDPSLEYLDRDIQMVTALYRIANGLESVPSKAIMAEIDRAVGEPQMSQKWSGSFVRLRQRGWMVEAESRSYRLTKYGESVARLGRDLQEWNTNRNSEGDFDLICLEALRTATDEAADAVTFDDVAWRFRSRWDAWGPSGHSVCQELLRLVRKGWVESERRNMSTLCYWRPTPAGLAQLKAGGQGA